MVLPATILGLLEAQFGLVTRAQLTGSGILPVTIDTWITRGRLVVVHRGVYRLPGTPVSRRQLLLAAMLRCGEGARAGGWSACGCTASRVSDCARFHGWWSRPGSVCAA